MLKDEFFKIAKEEGFVFMSGHAAPNRSWEINRKRGAKPVKYFQNWAGTGETYIYYRLPLVGEEPAVLEQPLNEGEIEFTTKILNLLDKLNTIGEVNLSSLLKDIVMSEKTSLPVKRFARTLHLSLFPPGYGKSELERVLFIENHIEIQKILYDNEGLKKYIDSLNEIELPHGVRLYTLATMINAIKDIDRKKALLYLEQARELIYFCGDVILNYYKPKAVLIKCLADLGLKEEAGQIIGDDIELKEGLYRLLYFRNDKVSTEERGMKAEELLEEISRKEDIERQTAFDIKCRTLLFLPEKDMQRWIKELAAELKKYRQLNPLTFLLLLEGLKDEYKEYKKYLDIDLMARMVENMKHVHTLLTNPGSDFYKTLSVSEARNFLNDFLNLQSAQKDAKLLEEIKETVKNLSCIISMGRFFTAFLRHKIIDIIFNKKGINPFIKTLMQKVILPAVNILDWVIPNTIDQIIYPVIIRHLFNSDQNRFIKKDLPFLVLFAKIGINRYPAKTERFLKLLLEYEKKINNDYNRLGLRVDIMGILAGYDKEKYLRGFISICDEIYERRATLGRDGMGLLSRQYLEYGKEIDKENLYPNLFRMLLNKLDIDLGILYDFEIQYVYAQIFSELIKDTIVDKKDEPLLDINIKDLEKTTLSIYPHLYPYFSAGVLEFGDISLLRNLKPKTAVTILNHPDYRNIINTLGKKDRGIISEAFTYFPNIVDYAFSSLDYSIEFFVGDIQLSSAMYNIKQIVQMSYDRELLDLVKEKVSAYNDATWVSRLINASVFLCFIGKRECVIKEITGLGQGRDSITDSNGIRNLISRFNHMSIDYFLGQIGLKLDTERVFRLYNSPYFHRLITQVKNNYSEVTKSILAFLIEHELDGDLINALTTEGSIGKYNKKILERAKEIDIKNIDFWLHDSRQYEFNTETKTSKTANINIVRQQLESIIKNMVGSRIEKKYGYLTRASDTEEFDMGQLQKRAKKYLAIIQNFLKVRQLELVKGEIRVLKGREEKDITEENLYELAVKLKEINDTFLDEKRLEPLPDSVRLGIGIANSHLDEILKAGLHPGTLVKNRKLTLKCWSRMPSRDIYTGNYTANCLSVENPHSSGAIFYYIMDLGISVIEITDENDISIAQMFLWLGENEKEKPVLIVDNIEVLNKYKGFSSLIRKKYFDYVKVMVNRLGIKEENVFIGGNYNDIDISDLTKMVVHVKKLGTPYRQGMFYLDATSGWGNVNKLNSYNMRSVFKKGQESTSDNLTRLEFSSDPDLSEDENKILCGEIKNAVTRDIDTDDRYIGNILNQIKGEENIIIKYIKTWALLNKDGLGFSVLGKDGTKKVISAFTVLNKDTGEKIIYMPDPEIILSCLRNKGLFLNGKIDVAIKTYLQIIATHEINEIRGDTHLDAVWKEIKISPLKDMNTADVITILLKTIINNNIKDVTLDFHRLFISNLLISGIPLTREIYEDIVRELLGKEYLLQKTTEPTIFNVYTAIKEEIDTTVRGYIKDLGYIYRVEEENVLDLAGFISEPGYKELLYLLSKEDESSGLAEDKNNTRILFVDLSRFFIENRSISDLKTIDYEYLKRFISFVKAIYRNNSIKNRIKIVGITDLAENNGQIKQLVSMMDNYLKNNMPSIEYGLDFKNYHNSIVQISEHLIDNEQIYEDEHTLSLLSNESINSISDSDTKKLKIITSSLTGHNRMASSGYEFSMALKGLFLPKDRFINFILGIADRLLSDLVEKGHISKEQKDSLLDKIKEKGIAFIPSYFDPVLYHKTIENQKIILTAA